MLSVDKNAYAAVEAKIPVR